jgi:isopentenyldiphosphate isomerase
MEIWDVYNRFGRKTGEKHSSQDKFEPGQFYLVVHVCIFNAQGQLLIQKRQPWKKRWPNLWDVSAAGRAQAGEDSAAAAERETLEELGLKIDLSNERPYFTMHFEAGFDDYYLIEREVELNQLTLQPEEVEAVRWADKAEVLKMVSNGEFIDYFFIEPLFNMLHHRGSMRTP